jgi:Fe2+ transport system protein FeoA
VHATMTLDQMPRGATGTISRPADCPHDALLLRAMGMREGVSIRVCQAGSPCIIDVDGCKLGLDIAMCTRVQVAATVNA